MADGRMLKKKISLNEAVADLANDSHRLLFTWGIAHLDVEGRITGSSRGFKALVAPLLDHITFEAVQAFFHDAESKGLIQRYEVDGEWHVQYPKFAHNQKLTKSREAASKRPAPPPDYSLPSQRPLSEDSVSAQPEVKLREGKGSEDKASAYVIGGPDDALPEKNSPARFKPGGLVDLWNELGCMPMVSELTEERRKKAALRIRKRNDPEWWRQVFTKARELNKPWLTFDFFLRNDTNAIKVLEGNYDRDFSRGDGKGQREFAGTSQPRGYDQREDLTVIEIPD